MTLAELTTRHAHLFPEEWYLAGGAGFTVAEETLDNFGMRYASHLDFYEKYLVHSPTEQTAKFTLHLAYHLAKQEKPDTGLLEKLNVFMGERSHATLSLPESIARVDLLNSIAALCTAHPDLAATCTHQEAYAHTPSHDTVDQIATDWQTWMHGLYGCTPLTRAEIMHELQRVPPMHAPAIPLTQPLHETIRAVSEILSQTFGTLIKNPEVIDLPSHLRSMIPSAAAYTFNRFSGETRRVTYLNESGSWNLAKLLLLVAHENFAHLWHFQEVDAHAPFAARLPAAFRYPITEGVALLVEEAVATHALAIATACAQRKLTDDADALRTALTAIVANMRRARLARALFEVCVYDERLTAEEALSSVAQHTGEAPDDLREDLFSFLPTPGYGATYCAGYFTLKAAGATFDSAWQKRIAEAGFDLGALCTNTHT